MDRYMLQEEFDALPDRHTAKDTETNYPERENCVYRDSTRRGCIFIKTVHGNGAYTWEMRGVTIKKPYYWKWSLALCPDGNWTTLDYYRS